MPITNQNGALLWATGIDNSGLKSDAEEGKSIIKDMSKDFENSASDTSDAIDKIGQSAIKSAKSQITAQKELIKQIEGDIKNLDKQFQNAAPGNTKSAALEELNYAKRALAEEKATLTSLEASLNTTADKHVMLRTQIMNVKDQLAQLEMQGKRNTPEFAALSKQLGELNDQFKDTATQATILANDQRGFQAIASGVSGMAGAMSAATGVMSLFGSENEDLAKVQARLQAVMAISIGLQQVSETINKDSYFSVVLVTKAKELWAAAELKLATAIGISTAASKAFLAVTGGAALIGLAALATAIMKVKKAHEEQTDAAVEAAKKEQQIQSDIAKGFAQEEAKIQSLITSIHSENVSRNDKLKMIKQMKDLIPGYTAELSKEGTVIRENKKAIDDYMSSLEKSLKLKAAEKELEEIYTKMYKLQKLVAENQAPQTGNQFTQNLAKQGDNSTRLQDQAVASAKNATTKAALAGIEDLTKQANVIKGYISSNGLVSDVVLGSGGKDSTKSIKEAYNATKDLNELLLDINQKTSSLIIDQQEDNLNKRLAIVEAEKNAELKAIQDQQTKIVEAYNKSQKEQTEAYNKEHPNSKKTATQLSTKPEDLQNSLKSIDPELSASIQAATAGVVNAYGEKAKTETEKWIEEILTLASEFGDKRVEIANKYNEKIAKLEANGQLEAADQARAERDKQISKETVSILEETNLYKTATDEKLDLSKKTTDALIEDIKRRIEAEKVAGKLSNDDAKKMLDDINQAQTNISDKKNQNNPFAQLKSAISGQKTAKSAYESAANDPTTSTEDLAKLESKANETNKSVAAAAATALQGTQAILQSVVGGLNDLGVLNEQQQKDAQNVIGMVGGAANIATGIATGNPMAIIQGSVDLLVNGYQLFDTRTKEANKQIEIQQKRIESLKESYNDLQNAVEEAFSATKAKLINQEIQNLQQQNIALTKQIQSEKSKKNPDSSAIKEYEAAIKENQQSIEDLKDSWVEALTGTDVMSAVETFAQAYADAWGSGESAAKKSTEVVKSLLKNALINYMKDQLQPQVEGIMTAIANAMQDGTISKQEQSAIDALTSALDAKAAEYEQALSPYLDSSSTSAVTGELQSAMTEGTGSQLVGLWNMTAMDIRWIREWISKQSLGTVQNDQLNLTQLMADISAIKVNTGNTAANTAALVESIKTLNSKLDEIKSSIKKSRL